MWNPHVQQSGPSVLGRCSVCISSLDIDDIDSLGFCQASCVLHLNGDTKIKRAVQRQRCLSACRAECWPHQRQRLECVRQMVGGACSSFIRVTRILLFHDLLCYLSTKPVSLSWHKASEGLTVCRGISAWFGFVWSVTKAERKTLKVPQARNYLSHLN